MTRPDDGRLELANDRVALHFAASAGGTLRQVTAGSPEISYFLDRPNVPHPDLVLVCDDEEIPLSSMELKRTALLPSSDGSLFELERNLRATGFRPRGTCHCRA